MPFLYGETDEKYVKMVGVTKIQKLKPLDTFKFNLNDLLEGNQHIKPYEVSISFKTSPDKLIELCTPIVNGIPLPKPFHWNVLEVTDWIRKLGFPQYQNTFKKNQINGRSLIRLDASYLVKMNIKDFDHITTITQAIRNLYGTKKSVFNRSISMPYRDLNNLYKFIKTKTGPKYDKLRRTDVGRMYHLIRPLSLYETHWQLLERWLKHTDAYETERIGRLIEKKISMYIPRKNERPPTPTGPKNTYRDCNGMPPCMCNWTKEKDLKNPWQFKCLRTRNKILNQTQKSECQSTENCKCLESQRSLTLLQDNIPHKYAYTHKNRISINELKVTRPSEI